ncbi:MAG: hypothetical protein U0470_09935 [Anaerolineae bacterium]
MGYVVAAWLIAGGVLAAYAASIVLRRRAVAAEALEIEAEQAVGALGGPDAPVGGDTSSR